MALSFIGKPISLISHSDVRYRGILAGIDPAVSTIQLSNVYSMGTESRRPPAQYIPPVQEPYQYIIFRASEVKDLAVDEPFVVNSLHDDPAVVGAAPMNSTSQTMQPPYPQQAPLPQPQHIVPPQQAPSGPQAAAQVPPNVNPRHSANQARRQNSIHSATASLETVERALGDLRVGKASATANNRNATTANGGPRPRRNGAAATPAVKPEVPTTDFDFQSSNARFDKAALAKVSGSDSEGDAANAEEGGEESKEKGKEGKPPAYDPKSSFFDTLSPGPAPAPSGRGRGARGGRGGRGSSLARTRREEERQRNVATFGEPGGVGLLGPGAYVGGWGGYGRNGGGRGRGRNPVVQGTA